jgi:HPt (histidine-containing phosphotransfer) domain-containing protein
MRALLNYVLLPTEISDFERKYLARMNRVGLVFFFAHLPVFVAISYFNGMGAISALLLTCAVLAGPTFAYFTFKNPRSLSLVFGFTAMLMGGLLVHFGQGPVQIEMHFYFFALLAMLALYGNPMSVVVAAVTVAVHHLMLWLYLPESIFNYEAPVWVVAVHAAFVVVEAAASCFIARNFFDNVIGLEKIVQARTAALDGRNADMRLVLDNVDQGFLTIDRDGTLSAEHSAIVEVWLGKLPTGTKFWEYLGETNAEQGIQFELGWDEVLEDIMPLELCLDQLPGSLDIGVQHFSFSYRPIMNGEELDKCLIVMTDVTAEVERQRSEQEQLETLRIFDRVLSDKVGFLEFFRESDSLVERISTMQAELAGEAEPDFTQLKRIVHTLKGNSAIFGIQTVAKICHEMESKIIEENCLPDPSVLETLEQRWVRIGENLQALLGERSSHTVEIEDAQFEAILTSVLARRPHEEIAQSIADWKLEPTKQRLNRIAAQAQGIANRLNKGSIDVEIEDAALRTCPNRWAGFWSSFVHVVRNAVDHGLETEEQRADAGKSSTGTLALKTYLDHSEFVVEIVDDGRGVNWPAVAAKAKQMGLPAENPQDLTMALFSDGVSTAADVSETSGRGVGMSAVRQACEELGGNVSIESQDGAGTAIRFRFPQATMSPNAEERLRSFRS